MADDDFAASARAALAGHDDERTEQLVDDIGKALGIDMAHTEQNRVDIACALVHAWLDEALPSVSIAARRALWSLNHYLRTNAAALIHEGEYSLPRREAQALVEAGLLEVLTPRRASKLWRVRATELGVAARRLITAPEEQAR